MPQELILTTPIHTLHLSRAGQERIIVLGYCNGRRSAQEIEQAVSRDQPDLFHSRREISDFALHMLGPDT